MTIVYRNNAPLTNADLNALFSAGGVGAGWPSWQKKPDTSDWQPVLARSLVHVSAYLVDVDGDHARGKLVGFVNVAWDGRDHAFVLDTRVHPDFRHRKIGVELVRRGADTARAAGCEVLHVDYSEELTTFYRACGFVHADAGILRL